MSPVVHTLNICSCQTKHFVSYPVAMKNSSNLVLWFFVINVCNHREIYETPCIIQGAEQLKEKDMSII
jgi:hypothetical protein